MFKSMILKKIKEEFKLWKKRHEKVYLSEEIHNDRLSVYYENWKWVEDFPATQSEDSSLKVELNKFADLTNEEFVAMYVSNGIKERKPLNTVILETSNLPESVDWRTKGAVTPVKDQK